MNSLIASLGSSKVGISVDTETNITDRYHERYCMGISLCIDGADTFYIPVGHDSWIPDIPNFDGDLSALFQQVSVPLIFHNAKFDLHVLRRAGVKIPEMKFYDTMLMCHLLFEEELNFGLDHMYKKYVTGTTGKIKDLARVLKDLKWEETPPTAMARYAERDAQATYELWEAIVEPFDKLYEKVWEIDSRFLLMLEQIEARGVRIDVAKTRYWGDKCGEQIIGLRKELGFDPAKSKQLHQKLFTPPPMGLGLKPLSLTPGGKPQVNTSFLEKTNHPVCGLLLQFRETQKQKTSYYDSYLGLVGNDYDRIHPSFKQHGTRTGRLSCADPNMQQIPRESPIKSLFLAEPGCELWEIDFKNIEMRLAAVYSQEPALLDTFREEGDVHQLTADLLGISRQFAKIINFLIIYGGGAEALAFQLRISVKEASQILAKFRSSYTKLFAKMNEATETTAKNNGWIRMWNGRRRHFYSRYDYHKAFNSIIQGGAFEIVKRAMLNLQGFEICNQVHDSVWLNVRDKSEVLKAEALMSDWTEETFGLKFSVESKLLSKGAA